MPTTMWRRSKPEAPVWDAGRAFPAVAAALAAVLLAACAASAPLFQDSRAFDAIVTPTVVAGACRDRLVTRGHTTEDGVARRYRFEHQFAARRADEHYVVDVAVAPAGRLLDVARYNQRLAEFRKTYADRGPDYLKSQFPEIGRRAQLEILGVGPGGASSAVTFTTTDERFDVRVAVSMLLPDGVKGPECAIESVARAIATRYDAGR